MTETTALDPLVEALIWCLEHLAHTDQANAAMHCAPVRYSPITFRVAEALEHAGYREESDTLEDVLDHVGRYAEDPGR
jgi:hypothetical protein